MVPANSGRHTRRRNRLPGSITTSPGSGVTDSVVCQSALRAKMLDDRVRSFIAAHPDAVVVDLGAGLDTGVFRVSPPAAVDWYSVDLPGVIALRNQVMPTGRPRPFGGRIGGRRQLARHHPRRPARRW